MVSTVLRLKCPRLQKLNDEGNARMIQLVGAGPGFWTPAEFFCSRLSNHAERFR